MISPEEHARRMGLYSQGLNDKQIGAAIGRSGSAIQDWRKKNNLPQNGSLLLKPEKEEERMALWRQGVKDQEMADGLGLSLSGIVQWRLNRGLPPNTDRNVARAKIKPKISPTELARYKSRLRAALF